MVLLKGFDERGFVFFTSYASRKARELAANPRAALLFHWQQPGRQVRIEGAVSRVPGRGVGRVLPLAAARGAGSRRSPPTSRSRSPRAPSSRRGSPRSRATPTRRGPADWGGYVLDPAAYEFWQHRDDRLHDRFRYEREPRRLADRAPAALNELS